MSEYYIHVKDEAGLWNCAGPMKRQHAYDELERIVSLRQDGPWKYFGEGRYRNKHGHTIEVKEYPVG